MLDGWARRRLDPVLARMARKLAPHVGADTVTLVSFGLGLAGAVAIACHAYWIGLLLILASRLGDGLDGAVARENGATDFGGYLDIVLDFAFYGAVVLAFCLADPHANALAGAVLLLSFYVNGASFLAFSVMAERHGMEGEARGRKSIFFTTGLAEASETLAFFVFFCLFPHWFAPAALVFAALCFYTALSRIVLAARAFK